MKFDLKKFGQALNMLGPAVLMLAGVPAPIIGMVIHGITVAESIKGATGAEKKAKVLELVRTSATTADMIVHPDVTDVDAEQITATVGNGIDAVIATINTVKNIPVKVS